MKTSFKNEGKIKLLLDKHKFREFIAGRCELLEM